MTISKGDHLVIKRGEHIITPEDKEAYHEFEVLELTYFWDVITKEPGYFLKVRVVK